MRRIDSPFVFSADGKSKPPRLHNAGVNLLNAAELSDFRFHDLRHSCASYLAMQGRASGEVAAVLRHKTLQMVKRYAHLSNEHTAQVVAALDERFFGRSG